MAVYVKAHNLLQGTILTLPLIADCMTWPCSHLFRVLSGAPCLSMQVFCCLSVVFCASELFILKDHPLKLASSPGLTSRGISNRPLPRKCLNRSKFFLLIIRVVILLFVFLSFPRFLNTTSDAVRNWTIFRWWNALKYQVITSALYVSI